MAHQPLARGAQGHPQCGLATTTLSLHELQVGYIGAGDQKHQTDCGHTENKKVLGDVFPEYKDWSKSNQEEKEQKAADRAKNPRAQEGEGDWMNVFDSGDQAVKSSMKKKD